MFILYCDKSLIKWELKRKTIDKLNNCVKYTQLFNLSIVSNQ